MSETQATQIQPTDDPVASAPPFVAYTHFPQAEAFLETHLGEAARFRMPDGWRNRIVRGYPWMALAFLPLHFVLAAALVGVTLLSSVLGSASVFASLLSLASFILGVMALPGLFKRERRGWTWFVYSLVPMALNSLLDAYLFGMAFNALVLFGAFQVKYRYR